MGRGLILKRQVPKDPHLQIMPHARHDHIRYYPSFRRAIPNLRADCPRVTHPFATLTKRFSSENSNLKDPVRLACLIHAASVRSEPGSNSPLRKFIPTPVGPEPGYDPTIILNCEPSIKRTPHKHQANQHRFRLEAMLQVILDSKNNPHKTPLH